MTSAANKPKPIAISSRAPVVLRGQHWPGNECSILLVHDAADDEDMDCWRPLIPSLIARGWSVVAFDLRGHGASDGDWDPDCAAGDLDVMVRWVRSEAARYVSVIAAGQSATHALSRAGEMHIDALVTLSPAITPRQSLADLRGAGESKLIVCGGASPETRRASERLRNAAIGWSTLVTVPTSNQGTALLTDDLAPHICAHIAGFLAEQHFIARHRVHQATGHAQSAAGTRHLDTRERRDRGR